MITVYKRNYHPLIILLFTSGMLSDHSVKQIPRTTRYNWRDFKHEDYYGYEWAQSYINQFDDIKEVFQSKFTLRAIKTILQTRCGFYDMLGEFIQHKNLLKLKADSIVSSIEDMLYISGMSVKKACKFYGISKDWYYTQRKNIVCSISPLKKCYRTHPNQLPLYEVIGIEQLVNTSENKRKPLSTIYYKAMEKSQIACGLTTFRKYAKAVGYVKPKYIPKERTKGFSSTYVFEWLHIDITNIRTLKDGLQKVAFVKDNYSSALLSYASTSGKAGSGFIAKLLQDTFIEHNLYDQNKDIHILSDGGSENKGEVLSWIKGLKAPPIVKKMTAMTNDFPFSNAMSEITHSIYKTEFMGGKISDDIVSHLKSLEAFMEYYNYNRFPCRLYGRTPMQVVNGASIDRKLYIERIKEAKIARAETNRNFTACTSSFGCGGIYS